MMKLHIINWPKFTESFPVECNAFKTLMRNIRNIKPAEIKNGIVAVEYDKEGLALFDVKNLNGNHATVEFTGTIK